MRTVTAAVAVLLLVATVATQQQRPQDIELQAAIRTATVDDIQGRQPYRVLLV